MTCWMRFRTKKISAHRATLPLALCFSRYAPFVLSAGSRPTGSGSARTHFRKPRLCYLTLPQTAARRLRLECICAVAIQAFGRAN
jgi:hypothetical protein